MNPIRPQSKAGECGGQPGESAALPFASARRQRLGTSEQDPEYPLESSCMSCHSHELAVRAFIHKFPAAMKRAAVEGLELVHLKFYVKASQYHGHYRDHTGGVRRLFLDTSMRSSATIFVCQYLRDGTELPAGVTIISMDSVNSCRHVLVVFSSNSVCQAILVRREHVVWGVVRSAPDPELEAMFA